MNRIDLRRCVASFGTAAVLLLQIPPALAGESQAGTKGSATVEVTFTKWITTGLHMAGETGGDVHGTFGGEVLQRIVSTNPTITQIIALEAVYEVQAYDGGHSFTALLRGGQTGDTEEGGLGSAILDGVILAGWRTGAHVRVEFQKISSCAGKPAGPCFQGTIAIGAAKK